jgi:DNA-binding transcriptional MerR regulator
MDYFTISDIEHLSGIKAHTLRIWEQRFNILKPARKDSQHRFYSNEDLKHVLLIAQLNKAGIKISKIASMSAEQIRAVSIEKGISEHLHDSFIEQLLLACGNLDETQFNKTYENISQQLSFENIVLQIFYPLLQRMGLFWMNDKARPVQEHFASHLITKKFILAIDTLEIPEKGASTILFNPKSEHHEIPLLFIHYLLRKNGKPTRYFGADVSIEIITDQEILMNAQSIHLHVITNFSNKTMDELVSDLLQRTKKHQLIISGPQVNNITIKNKRLHFIHTLDELFQSCSS